jgi:hypothetical protein
MNVKELVRDSKMCDFLMCEDQELWYKTRVEGFEFPIPLSEVKGGTYYAEMKCITLMRYIRQYIKLIEG